MWTKLGDSGKMKGLKGFKGISSSNSSPQMDVEKSNIVKVDHSRHSTRNLKPQVVPNGRR